MQGQSTLNQQLTVNNMATFNAPVAVSLFILFLLHNSFFFFSLLLFSIVVVFSVVLMGGKM